MKVTFTAVLVAFSLLFFAHRNIVHSEEAPSWPTPPKIPILLKEPDKANENLEIFRKSVEDRRQLLEKMRKSDIIDRPAYEKGMKQYKKNIEVYKDSMNAVSGKQNSRRLK